jgi:TolA-binding protein
MTGYDKPTPHLSDERVDQLWKATAPRVAQSALVTRRRVQVMALAAGLLVVLGVGLGLGLRSRVPTVELAEGQLSVGPAQLSLPDRSTIALEPLARVQLEHAQSDEVRLALTGGRARFSVTKNKARSFHVLSRGVDVRVVGTRFVVEDLGDGVLVSVEEGVVEVRSGEELRRLTAGQSWRASALPPPPVEHASAAPPAPPPEPLEAEPAVVDDAPAKEAVTTRPPRSAPARHHGGGANGAGQATPMHTVDAPQTPPPAPTGPGADDLFRAGLEARRAGRSHEARGAWQTFLNAYPDDARAGLASFELGRIEMDVEHDALASLTALQRALAVAPQAAFAEDALARVVQLYDQRHDGASCTAAKSRYLSRYPHGTYAASLASLCGH